jgi:hypothetical protein
MRQTTNLYPGAGVIPGHYIYKVKNRNDRYLAQIKYPIGKRGGLFYSLEEAINWVEEQRAWDMAYTPTPGVINT